MSESLIFKQLFDQNKAEHVRKLESQRDGPFRDGSQEDVLVPLMQNPGGIQLKNSNSPFPLSFKMKTVFGIILVFKSGGLGGLIILRTFLFNWLVGRVHIFLFFAFEIVVHEISFELAVAFAAHHVAGVLVDVLFLFDIGHVL